MDAAAVDLMLTRELDEITVADRIRQSTDLRVQDRIDAALIARVGRCYDAPAHALTQRIAELEREWSVERMLTLQSSATALYGLVMGTFARRRWLLLAFATTGFLLQHAVQGWCPPLAMHRRFGMRTQREIDLEIHMLKVLRGDFTTAAAAAASAPPD